MLATLFLAAVLQPLPAQGGALKLTHDRLTYGPLGPERKSDKFLPGDVFVVSFDIEGLTIKDTGEMNYSVGTELLKGKASQFKNLPMDMKAINVLGGPKLPAEGHYFIPPDTAPGEYTFIITVSDGKVTEKLEKKFEVVPLKQVGIVGFTVMDPGGATAMPSGFVGQKLILSYGLVGFDVDPKDKNPNVTVEFSILDKDSKKTFKPEENVEKTLKDPSMKFIPRFHEIPLTRSGTYTLVVKATDNVGKKTVEEKLTITVQEPPK
jgi:hypothetical protein